jgi:hypothetical protein
VCVMCWKSNGVDILIRRSSVREAALDAREDRGGLVNPRVDDEVAEDRLNMLLVLRRSIPPLFSSAFVDASGRSEKKSILSSLACCEDGRDQASSSDKPERERCLCLCEREELGVPVRGLDLDLDGLLSSLLTRL